MPKSIEELLAPSNENLSIDELLAPSATKSETPAVSAEELNTSERSFGEKFKTAFGRGREQAGIDLMNFESAIGMNTWENVKAIKDEFDER